MKSNRPRTCHSEMLQQIYDISRSKYPKPKPGHEELEMSIRRQNPVAGEFDIQLLPKQAVPANMDWWSEDEMVKQVGFLLMNSQLFTIESFCAMRSFLMSVIGSSLTMRGKTAAEVTEEDIEKYIRHEIKNMPKKKTPDVR